MRYLALASLLLPALVLAQDPDKNAITIAQVTHSGNGCPQGTVSTSISPDKKASCPEPFQLIVSRVG
jgi:ribosomal protein L11 methylase PrmA